MVWIETEGQRLLAEAMQQETQESLALLLSVTQAAVSFWVAGKRRPDPHHRIALKILLGIPVNAWLTEEERGLIERIRAHVADRRKPAS